MSYCLNQAQMNILFSQLRKNYKIYAPKRFPGKGRYCDTDLVRYDEIKSINEVAWDSRGDYSSKEAYYPINQTLFHFTEFGYTESQIHNKGILIFVHPCDIHAIQRLDAIFLKNNQIEDYYYKRLREKVKFILLECNGGWESCFCCSMGTNKTENYHLALRHEAEKQQYLIEVKDSSFSDYFAETKTCSFTPEFVQENQNAKVEIPEITAEMIPDIHKLAFWQQYNSRCVGCGACNIVCPTCSCFNTIDTTYTQNEKSGERRRTQTGCMANDFTTVNGGHAFRDTKADRMRFKVLHKIYDFKLRFGENHMCVGCGRCDDICPQYISYIHAVDQLAQEVKAWKGGK